MRLRSRRLLLSIGIVALLGVTGYLAFRSSWVRGWFAADCENPAEVARLAEKKIDLSPIAPPGEGWPQWRGPLRDGRAPAGPLRTNWDQKPPLKLWSTPCGGGYSSPVVAGGQVFTQDREEGKERVICVDAESGSLLWAYSYVAEAAGKDGQYATGPRATPTLDGNRLYCVGGAGKFLCLEKPAKKGEQPVLCWQHDLLSEFGGVMPQWGVACSPVIVWDLVIVQPGGTRGSVAAFDRTTGEVRWRAGANPAGYSSPVAATIEGLPVVFALTGDALLAITLDGKVTDTYDWKPRPEVNAVTPLVVEDYVFISSAYGYGSALVRATRKGDGVRFVPVYTRPGHKNYQNQFSTSVYFDRHLYGFNGTTSSARLSCMDFDSGHVRPEWAETEIGMGTLILADRYLIIQTERGQIALVEARPDTFRLVSEPLKVLSGKNNWATPALVDGRLYLRDEQQVVCYDVRP
jgi:outer membrane protein assembly factor BamB